MKNKRELAKHLHFMYALDERDVFNELVDFEIMIDIRNEKKLKEISQKNSSTSTLRSKKK